MLGYEVGSAGGDIDLGGAVFQLNLQPPHPSDDEGIERAVALARDADAAVVVVGTTEEVESEGFDRTSLALPGRQDELVRRVAAANPRTIVVVNAGAPVLLPWADEVAAVLLAWFPGQEFGNALADVLLGAAEPGGRLPTTWPASEDRLPSTAARRRRAQLRRGAVRRLPRQRARRPLPVRPRPRLHDLGVPRDRRARPARPGEDFEVAVTVANTGDRRGREVVQVYAGAAGGPRRAPAALARRLRHGRRRAGRGAHACGCPSAARVARALGRRLDRRAGALPPRRRPVVGRAAGRRPTSRCATDGPGRRAPARRGRGAHAAATASGVQLDDERAAAGQHLVLPARRGAAVAGEPAHRQPGHARVAVDEPAIGRPPRAP